MLDSPLLPWVAEPGKTPLTETLTDPVSEASITLPRLNGLTVNEVMFLGWASENFPNLNQGLSQDPKVVADLVQFCHNFLCLRLEKADWGGDGLVWEGEPLKPTQTLRMTGADGQPKAATLYLMYLVYGFAIDEEKRWLGEQSPGMVEAVLGLINRIQEIRQSTGEMSGASSTGDSLESTQVIPDSPAETTVDAPRTLSQQRSKASKKAA
jgi:hypothetical protein